MGAGLARITEMAELERHNTEIKCTELVEHGRFSTISDAVEIALEDLIPKIESGPYATRCEIMQVADAFRAKIRRGLLWKS